MASAIDARGRLSPISPTLDAEGHAPAVAPPKAAMSRQPTLRFPGPSSALGAKGKWAPSDIVTRWTNTDVVMWALNKDLKVHIPALVQHGLTGSALQQLNHREDIKRALKVDQTEVTDEFALSAFEGALKDLMPSVKTQSQTAQEVWGTDKDGKDRKGRLLLHPSGWTYDKEYNEWDDYLEAERENAIAAHLNEIITNVQSRYQLVTLVLSSIVSVMTSTSFSGAEFTDNDTWNVVMLVLTLLITLCSGYTQLNQPRWKALQEQCKKHMTVYESLIDRFNDELQVSVEERTPYPTYNKEITALWKELRDHGRIDAPPALRSRAISRIKRTDPSMWTRAFAFSERRGFLNSLNSFFLSWIGCDRIELDEPMDELYDAMLMRFSGEDMGEYTTEPDVFKEDKAEAKMLYQAMMTGQEVENGEKRGRTKKRRVADSGPQKV